MIDVIVKRKRCPFCEKTDTRMDANQDGYWVKCMWCGARGPHERTEQEAKESWNRRPLEDEAFSEGMCAEARDE